MSIMYEKLKESTGYRVFDLLDKIETKQQEDATKLAMELGIEEA